MKKLQNTCLTALALSLFAFAGCETMGKKSATPAAPETVQENSASPSQEDLLKRGKYLVSTMDCTGCHSPKKMTPQGPEPDEALFLSGHPANETLPPIEQAALNNGWILMNGSVTAFVGPWGTSFAANLTPHPTGIGNWSFDHFKKAIREGKYRGMEGTRMIMPPMPWPVFKNLTDEDLEAIFAYLKSIKPIDNQVPAYMPPVAQK